MINIAICDDDEATTFLIEEMIYKLAFLQHIKVDCDIFFDGSTLVESIRHGAYYDLIYLDIEMRKTDGIRAAEMIRYMDTSPLIVFLSSNEKNLKDLFHTEPFHFLSKPLDAKAFRFVFLAAYKRIARKTEYFSYTYNKRFLKIPLAKISYFSSRNRVIYIHVVDSIKTEHTEYDEAETKFYGKMNNLEEQLAERKARFIRIHQSYLINFDYMKSMSYKSVLMSDGTLLQISEDRHKSVRNQAKIFLESSRNTTFFSK